MVARMCKLHITAFSIYKIHYKPTCIIQHNIHYIYIHTHKDTQLTSLLLDIDLQGNLDLLATNSTAVENCREGSDPYSLTYSHVQCSANSDGNAAKWAGVRHVVVM